MEISAEKTKKMANSANDIQREIKVKGLKLGTSEHLFLMIAQNKRFSHGFCKSLQILQS